MAFFNRLLTGVQPHTAQGASGSVASDGKNWRRILVPAVGRPFSARAIEVACRLAKSSNGTVHLAYVVEIPRSMVIDAPIPDLEEMAATVLQEGEDIVRQYKVPVISSVFRTRHALDGVIKLVKEAQCDLLVLGGRPDEVRGLPKDLTRQLFKSAPCEVVLDYIAGDQ